MIWYDKPSKVKVKQTIRCCVEICVKGGGLQWRSGRKCFCDWCRTGLQWQTLGSYWVVLLRQCLRQFNSWVMTSISSSMCRYHHQHPTSTRCLTSLSVDAASAMVTPLAVLCRHATINDSFATVDTIPLAQTASAANRSITIDLGQERLFVSQILVSVRFTVFDTTRVYFS